jgi:hypothetical protein
MIYIDLYQGNKFFGERPGQPGCDLGAPGEWPPVTTPQCREVGGADRHLLICTKMMSNGNTKDGRVRQNNEERNDQR